MLLQTLKASARSSKYPPSSHHEYARNTNEKNRQFKSKRCKWRSEHRKQRITNETTTSGQRSYLKFPSVDSMERRDFSIKFSQKNLLHYATVSLIVICLLGGSPRAGNGLVQGSLIIGDSAIEITELDQNQPAQPAAVVGMQQQQQQQQQQQSGQLPEQSSLILGSTSNGVAAASLEPAQLNQQSNLNLQQQVKHPTGGSLKVTSGPLPPILSGNNRAEDAMDGDKTARGNQEYEIREFGHEKDALSKVLPVSDQEPEGKAITGKVVDFELTPAGGHNKAKIKKKKKKKMKKVEEMSKKWSKKKEMEKKAMEKKEKESMKKKKEQGSKKKKKWGHEEHGQKKKGKFKKKKWGKKVKKGKGTKSGKKGKKFLKDKGHKKTGFKTVYHKEEWGKSAKWHDIKRDKKWDEKAKVWKQKWKNEKGKKYSGKHMKKFEKKKKHGKKFKKEKKEKFKKHIGEKFKKGHKKKKEEFAKKKEGGKKKMEKEMKKKKKKKKG